ncbi:MAG: AbrB/MazE/SpoVT family DNA-binding domain-containing protein [Deltaproteobacteria bacterium]|nr:AbrB/MazE/SpoVT family DNA-binding domain-containing protein [Deltaproteobacteria bacterium]
MVRKKAAAPCCGNGNLKVETCRVESIVSVDERGQMVLPKELRKRAGIKAGDRLAVASWVRGGEVCCITLIKVEELVEMMKDRIGPLMKDMLKEAAHGKKGN